MSEQTTKKAKLATQTVLVLGAGLIAAPGVRYLAEAGFRVILGSRTLAKAQAMVAGLEHAEAREIDVESADGLKAVDALLADGQVHAVLSLLPYIHHALVAERALKAKAHFFTTSYTSDALQALEPAFKVAGLVMLNECGVDPGTDHMSAMRTIDEAHAAGGTVRLFTSFCGGLPAPADNDNPFGYKFSWAPRGVLLASKNPATYLQDGKKVEIAAGELFDYFVTVKVDGVDGADEFECYPNRDSTPYAAIYGINDVKTLQRGTFRYKGQWCKRVRKLGDLGYLSLDERDNIADRPMRALTAELVGAEPTADADAVRAACAKKLNLALDDDTLDAFAWAGLFSDDKAPRGTKTLLDALCAQMLPRMKYTDGQRDMLLMQHKYEIEFDDRVEYRSTTMVDYGEPNGTSSMARLVSIPMAIAMRVVLHGEVKLEPGLHRPIKKNLYKPILDELDQKYNVQYVDKLDKVEKK